MNLQELLLSYFKELDPDIKEIVSEVYFLERENIDFFDGSQHIKPKIKDIIDRVASFNLRNKGD